MSAPNQAAIREAIQRARELASKITNNGPVKRTASELDTNTVKVSLAYEKPPDFDHPPKDNNRGPGSSTGVTNHSARPTHYDEKLPDFDTPPRDRSRGPGPAHYDEKLEIIVPHSVIGLVIGRGGANIKRIQNETGATVRVDPSTVDEKGNKVCTITGTKQAVEEAHKQVESVIENSANNNKRPRTQPNMTRQGHDHTPPRGLPPSMLNHNQHPHNPHQNQPIQQSQQSQPRPSLLRPNTQQQPSLLGQQPTADMSAAWAAYYAQYSSLLNQTQQTTSVPQQLPNQPTSIPSMTGQIGTGVGMAPSAPPTVSGGSMQPDYTDSWIEYYLANGRPDYAEQVIEMKKQRQMQQQQMPPQPTSLLPTSSVPSSLQPPPPPSS